MKKEVIVSLIVLILTLNFIAAESISEDLHLNIQVIDTSGDVDIGTFAFVFNISNNSDCSVVTDVVYSNSTTLTTDSRGIISYYLEDVNLSFSEQYWLCYYRNGTLINSSKIARTPYSFTARNISAEGIINDSNIDLTGYNVTGSSGLFSWLGSLLNRITKLFVQDITFNGSINGSGNITTTGNVTADYFFGDASELTGVEGTYNSSAWNRSGTDVFLHHTGDSVGIGTSTPESKLEVRDLPQNTPMTISLSGVGAGVYDKAFQIKNSTGDARFVIGGVTSYAGTNSIGHMTIGGGTAYPQIRMYSMGNWGWSTQNNFFIRDSSTVGITTGTYSGLAIIPTISTTDGQTVTGYYGINVGGTKSGTGTIGYARGLSMGAMPTATTMHSLYISNTYDNYIGGKVGIGTSTPQNTLNVDGDINSTGLFYGNGSQLTDISFTESDPFWTANQSSYYNKTEVDTNISDANTSMKSYVDAQDTSYNDSMKLYVDSQDTTYNDSMKSYVDGLNGTWSATDLDGYNSTFFMPLNTSVYGNFSFNGGWGSHGLSIIDGDIYAQTGYFYNITSLNVTKKNLTIIENLTIGGHLFSSGTGDNYFMGNVGIGTTGPGQKLDIASNSPIIRLTRTTSATANGWIEWVGSDAVVDWKLAVNNNIGAGMEFTEGASNVRMYIAPGGNVAVGSDANPGAKLSVLGGVAIGSSYATTSVSDGNLIISGNVGIGTTAPAYKLEVADVEKALNVSGVLYVNGTSGRVGIGTTSPETPLEIKTPYSIPLRVHATGSHGSIQIYENGAERGRLGYTDDGGILIGATADSLALMATNKLHLAAGGNTNVDMTVDTTGNVGINTTTPQNTLNVVGDANFTGLIYGNGSQLTGISGGGGSPAGAEGAIQFYDGGSFGGNASQFFINKTSGNVGIGTTSPGKPLEVVGGGAFGNDWNIRLKGGSGARFTGLEFMNDSEFVLGYILVQQNAVETLPYSDSGVTIVSDGGDLHLATRTSNGDISFFTDGNQERLTILDSTGNVGIGTITPESKLAVGGSGDSRYAIYGVSHVSGGFGVHGYASNASGDTTYGVYGYSPFYGVYGKSTGSTGSPFEVGVYGQAVSGKAVYGHATGLTGSTYGVYGESDSSSGRGVSGTGWIGVRGVGDSSTGYSGYFTGGKGIYLDNNLTVGGNVGIGTESPSNKLDVVGVIFAGDADDGVVIREAGNVGDITGINSALSAYNDLYLRAGNSPEGIYIKTDGNVGIGDTSPDAKLDVEGTIYATGYGRDAHSEGHLVGSYNSVGSNDAKSNPIYTIGSSYNPGDATIENMYGVGYSHDNWWYDILGEGESDAGWGFYVAADGNVRVTLSGATGDIWSAQDITAVGSGYFGGGIKIGDVTTCDSSTAGTIRYKNYTFWGCDGDRWWALLGEAAELYVYVTTADVNPDFASRANIDTICANYKPSAVSCTNIHAFVSFDSDDQISDMPFNFGYSSQALIYWVHPSTGAKTLLAQSWSDMLDGSIENTQLDGTGVSNIVWTGSTPYGIVTDTTCTRWTSTSSSFYGTRGRADLTTGTWLGDGTTRCVTYDPNRIRCVCTP